MWGSVSQRGNACCIWRYVWYFTSTRDKYRVVIVAHFDNEFRLLSICMKYHVGLSIGLHSCPFHSSVGEPSRPICLILPPAQHYLSRFLSSTLPYLLFGLPNRAYFHSILQRQWDFGGSEHIRHPSSRLSVFVEMHAFENKAPYFYIINFGMLVRTFRKHATCTFHPFCSKKPQWTVSAGYTSQVKVRTLYVCDVY